MSVKPTNPVINRSHPLARGLVGAWAVSSSTVPASTSIAGQLLDVAGGSDGTITAGSSPVALVRSSMGLAIEPPSHLGSVNSLVNLGEPTWWDDVITKERSWTLSVWAKTTEADNLLLTKADGASAYRGIQWCIGTSGEFPGGQSLQLFNNNASSNLIINYTTTRWDDGLWHLHTAVYRGSTGTISGTGFMDLYVDGVAQPTAAYPIAGPYSLTSSPISSSNDAMVYSSRGGNVRFNHAMLDLRVYDRALTPSEALSMYVSPFSIYSPAIDTFERHYLLPLPRPPIAEKGVAGTTRQGIKPSNPTINRSHPLARGLVGAWPFEDGGGTVLRDVSGHGHDGTLTGTTAYVSSPTGGAFDYQASQYHTAGANGVSGAQGSLVIRLDSDFAPTTGGYDEKAIFNVKGAGGTGDLIFLGIIRNTSPSLYGLYAIYRYNSGTRVFLDQGAMLTAGQWYHVVYTWDSLGVFGTRFNLYIDGVLVDSSDASVGTFAKHADDVLYIGDYSTGVIPHDGRISDVRVYDRPLSASEVLATYIAGNDLYSPAVGTQERYYERVALPSAGQPAFKRWSQRTNQPIFGRGF